MDHPDDEDVVVDEEAMFARSLLFWKDCGQDSEDISGVLGE